MGGHTGLSEGEFQRRLPVWCALSDLFLDTERTEHDLQHIARVAREAGYCCDEVEQALLHEVAPVFLGNLLSPAGEWTAWPADFVADRMRGRVGRHPSASWFTVALARRLLRHDWSRLRTLLRQSTQPQLS